MPLSHKWGERDCTGKSVNLKKKELTSKVGYTWKLLVLKTAVLPHRVMTSPKTSYTEQAECEGHLHHRFCAVSKCQTSTDCPVPAAPALRVLPNHSITGRHRSPLLHDQKELVSHFNQRILLGFWTVLTPQVNIILGNGILIIWKTSQLLLPVNHELKQLIYLPISFTHCCGLVKRAGC